MQDWTFTVMTAREECKGPRAVSQPNTTVTLFRWESPLKFLYFCPLKLIKQMAPCSSQSPAEKVFTKPFKRSPKNPPVAQMVKNPPAKQEIWVRSLGRADPLEKGMATHSSILAWRIPRTEEPDTTKQLTLSKNLKISDVWEGKSVRCGQSMGKCRQVLGRTDGQEKELRPVPLSITDALCLWLRRLRNTPGLCLFSGRDKDTLDGWRRSH